MIENPCTAWRTALRCAKGKQYRRDVARTCTVCDQHDRFRSLRSPGPVLFYWAIGPDLGVVGPVGDAAHEDAMGVTISRVRLRCHHRARPRAGHLTHSELIGGPGDYNPDHCTDEDLFSVAYAEPPRSINSAPASAWRGSCSQPT